MHKVGLSDVLTTVLRHQVPPLCRRMTDGCYLRCRRRTKLQSSSIDSAAKRHTASWNGATSVNGRLTEGLSADGKSFSSVFSIRGYEVLADRRASIVTIANLFQETSANHGVALWGMADGGFAVDPIMAEQNLIFALVRLQIQMIRYPDWGEMVSVETWLRTPGKASANREYILRSAKMGDVLGKGTSQWVCMNTKTQRIVRFPDDLQKRSVSFIPQDRPSPIASEETRLKIEDIDPEHAVQGPVRFAGHMNIDMNNHINNVAYLTWALDILPDAIFESYQLKQIEMDFKGECSAGDSIEGSVMELKEPMDLYEKQFIHSLFMMTEGSKKKELVRLRTSWVESIGS